MHMLHTTVPRFSLISSYLLPGFFAKGGNCEVNLVFELAQVTHLQSVTDKGVAKRSGAALFR
jgi:hypothetical protein